VVGTLAFVAVAASMVTDHGGLRGVVTGASDAPAARFLLWPAVAVGDLATPDAPGGVAGPVLGLLAIALASLVPPLLLQVGFLEARAARGVVVRAAAAAAVTATKGPRGACPDGALAARAPSPEVLVARPRARLLSRRS
jgi:hypothetical protein